MSMRTYIEYCYGFRFGPNFKTTSDTYTEGFKKLMNRAPKTKALLIKDLTDIGTSWDTFKCFEDPCDTLEDECGMEDEYLSEYIGAALNEIYEPKFKQKIFARFSADDYEGPIIGAFMAYPWQFNKLEKKLEQSDIDNILKYNIQPMFDEPITIDEHIWETYG